MRKDKKLVIVLPADDAELTLQKTYNEIPFDIVIDVILIDDCSKDKRVEESKANVVLLV